MRNIFFQVIILILMFSFTRSQTRYKDEIFSEVIKTEDVVYGNAPDIPFDGAFEWYTADIDLTMDIYEGDGDTLINRPVIVFMHSGGFFTGSHEADDMVALANSSAKMGYVAVSIVYRLNFNLFSTYSAERAFYRGLQDLSAAVRYLREHHSDYGIDYNNIFIWGSSAGAFSGIHLSYMEEEDRMASTFVNNFGWDPDLGCIDCSGNDFDHDRKPRAVIACWGGIFDLDWINEGDEIPVIMFHGTADSTVQFNEGYPFQNQFSLPWLYGSNLVFNKLDSLNIQSELHGPEGMDHEYWGTYAGDWTGDGPNEHFDIIKEEAYSFLFDMLYPFQIEPLTLLSPPNQEIIDITDGSGVYSFMWNNPNEIDSLSYKLVFDGDLEFLQSQTINSSLAIIQISDVIEQMYDLNIDTLTGSWRIEVSNVEFVANGDQNGPFQLTFINENILNIFKSNLPKNFSLKQNYPNPFNPITSLWYDLPEDGLVNITIYDMMGRMVKTLVNGSQKAGFKSAQWNATNNRNEPVSAGLYLYTMHAGEFRQTKKMLLLK
mgnify:FL=1